ncbi:MAG: hypothetical protein ACRCX2_09690 [Paraclostridium sp.]
MKLQKIAERHGLEIIETTDRSNGYPSNLKGAIIGFESFKQAEEIAEKYNLEITSFHKKDGWNFYYRTGANMYKAFTNSCEDYGDNYSEVEKMGEEDFIDREVLHFFSGNVIESFEQIESFLSSKKEIWEEVNKMEDDEIVITHEGNYYETIKKESMYFYHDTKYIVIGVQEK